MLTSSKSLLYLIIRFRGGVSFWVLVSIICLIINQIHCFIGKEQTQVDKSLSSLELSFSLKVIFDGGNKYVLNQLHMAAHLLSALFVFYFDILGELDLSVNF